MTTLGLEDDGFEEDLGPRSAAEEFFGEYLQGAAEGFVEDKDIKLDGTSAAAVLAAIPYVAAKKIAAFGPFAAMGADPFFGAKHLARGMFTALGALASNSNVPRPLFNLLRAFGPVGKGVVSGSIDRARRMVIKYLSAWSKMANPEAAMGPALGVAEGIIEFNWAKISGKASGLPSPTASTSAGGYGKRMEGMGDMKETLHERLRRLAATEATRVEDIRVSITVFGGSFRSHWQAINEASERLLVDPDVIIRAFEAPDDGELADPDGGTALVTNRVFALKRLAASCKKLVAKAREEDGTGPKDKSTAETSTVKGPALTVGAKTFNVLGRELPNPLHHGLDVAVETAREIVDLNPQAETARNARYAELRDREDAAYENPSLLEKARRLLRRE